MKVFNQVFDVRQQYKGTAIALGTFDGVHIGHQKLINRAVELANINGGSSAVFTFSNHPLSVIDPKRCPLQIVTPEYKVTLLKELSVDFLVTIPFTHQFLKLTPKQFIDLLYHNIKPRYVVVGPNYSFGYKGAGTPELLKQKGQEYGFEVEVHPAVYLGGTLVSSTYIRQKIIEGNVSEARKLLGRPLRVFGCVVTGDQRGRVLGYPTANLEIARGLAIPADGVYAVQVIHSGIKYQGVANVGTNPTFCGSERHIEVHILQFDGNIYGAEIAVDFIERIREEKTFSSVQQLVEQIACDIKFAAKLLEDVN